MDSPHLRRIASALWTDDPRTRIRLQRSSLTLAMYIACGAEMSLLTPWGVLSGSDIATWLSVMLGSLAIVHVLIRSGWSLRLADPAMSEAQIIIGLFSVMAGYTISGEARSSVLFPLMVILNFGAFSVSWRRMVELTVLALALMGATMLGMHALQPGRYSTVIDVANFLIALIVLPAASAVAMMLGSLRARLKQQRAELQDALARIQEQATRDELTGLSNRRHAQQLLDFEAQRTQRTGQPFAVALIDLDHFKRLNDRHGHAGGDEVLRRFAAEARAGVRGFDMVARWGGEEFLLVMPTSAAAAAYTTMERLREGIAAIRMSCNGQAIAFTCSAGVAEHRPGESVAQTVSRADDALYRAKAAGRNRVELATAVGVADPAAPTPPAQAPADEPAEPRAAHAADRHGEAGLAPVRPPAPHGAAGHALQPRNP